jgi:hypothetical protein
MRRFDVWRTHGKDRTGAERYVLILQSEKIDHLTTIIVAPLRAKATDMFIPSLTPEINVNAMSYTALIPLMISIDRKLLDVLVCSVEERAYEITKAIDRVFSGI